MVLSTDSMLRKVAKTNAGCSTTQLDRYGERYFRYRQDYDRAGRQELEPDFPLYIHFEQTYHCNLRCPSCIQGYQDEKRKYNTGVPVMPRALYEKIILECEAHGCASVAMHSIDEPLLVPDIAERIRFARDHGVMDVFMTTNGQLLTGEIANAVCDAGLTHILFSTDAATPETYARVRVRGDFARTLAAIGYIRAWRERNSSELPIIRASFVLSQLNQHEEELFIERFGDLVDYIDIQSFYGIGKLNRHLVPNGHATVKPSEFGCAEAYRKVVVRANGDVVPCCSPFGFRLVMGNANTQSIKEIFNGQAMRSLRRQLKERRFNPVCGECVSNLYEKTAKPAR